MKEKVQAILGQGITCFCNRQLIYNHAEEMFADDGHHGHRARRL